MEGTCYEIALGAAKNLPRSPAKCDASAILSRALLPIGTMCQGCHPTLDLKCEAKVNNETEQCAMWNVTNVHMLNVAMWKY